MKLIDLLNEIDRTPVQGGPPKNPYKQKDEYAVGDVVMANLSFSPVPTVSRGKITGKRLKNWGTWKEPIYKVDFGKPGGPVERSTILGLAEGRVTEAKQYKKGDRITYKDVQGKWVKGWVHKKKVGKTVGGGKSMNYQVSQSKTDKLKNWIWVGAGGIKESVNEDSERFLKSAGGNLARQVKGNSARWGYLNSDVIMNRLNLTPLGKGLKDDEKEKVVKYAMDALGLKESVNEGKFKKGQYVKYIVPGTSDKIKRGKITDFESTRDEDFAVIDGKTISFSHISESVNESDAYTLRRLANNVGEETAKEFLSTHNIDLKLLAKAISQKTIDKYTLRDIVNGKAHPSHVKKFMKQFVKESVNTIKKKGKDSGEYRVYKGPKSAWADPRQQNEIKLMELLKERDNGNADESTTSGAIYLVIGALKKIDPRNRATVNQRTLEDGSFDIDLRDGGKYAGGSYSVDISGDITIQSITPPAVIGNVHTKGITMSQIARNIQKAEKKAKQRSGPAIHGESVMKLKRIEMKRTNLSSLINEIKKERKILKEYFTREGDDIEEILVLNLFGDMLEAPVEDMIPGIEDTVNKYRPIAEDLEKRLSKYFGKFPLTSHWSKRIDGVMYDGNDAYQSPEEFRDSMPSIYDPQIEIVEELLDILEQASI